jgi:hypothetical protein
MNSSEEITSACQRAEAAPEVGRVGQVGQPPDSVGISLCPTSAGRAGEVGHERLQRPSTSVAMHHRQATRLPAERGAGNGAATGRS